ncbi:MAG: glycosyltransferase family 39 protein [Chloroflexi bacterium]|nr:glycosyltransferase family 39 protein [Chloroflexota bacterium]
MLENRGTLWRATVVLSGLLALLVGYYWVHKPLHLGLLLALGGAALDALTVFLIVLVGGGLGRRLFLFVRTHNCMSIPPPISRAERAALDALLGLGALGGLALLLGLIGLYTGAALWLALLVMALLARRALLDWLHDMEALAQRAAQPGTAWTRLLALLTGLLLVMALLRALAPPLAYDALNYHLVGPARYLAVGRIAAYPDHFFLGFPQGVEILYGVALSLFGRDTAAAPLHFAFGLLGLLAAGGLARRYAGEAAGWLAVTLLLSAYSVWKLLGWPYVDLAVLAYGAAALVVAVAWRDSGSPRWLVVMGVIGGLALGVKYTAVGLLLALAVFVALRQPRRIVRNGLLLGLSAALVFLPWALKGALLYHNPVYPFLFGGLNWDAVRSTTFSTPGTGLLGTGKEWQLITLPLAATILGREEAEGFGFTLGPWLLTTPLLLPLGWRWLDERTRRLARDCALLGLPLLGFWLVMASLSNIGAQTRLMVMALPVAAVAGAIGIESLSRWPRKPLDIGFVVRAALVLTLALGTLETLRETVQVRAVPYLLGMVSRNDFLTANLGGYALIRPRLAELPDGARVRQLWEARTYFCPPRIACAGDLLFDHWARSLRQLGTPEAVFSAWKQADDYLLFYDVGFNFWKTDPRFATENAQFLDALAAQVTPVWSEGGYTLYRWKQP